MNPLDYIPSDAQGIWHQINLPGLAWVQAVPPNPLRQAIYCDGNSQGDAVFIQPSPGGSPPPTSPQAMPLSRPFQRWTRYVDGDVLSWAFWMWSDVNVDGFVLEVLSTRSIPELQLPATPSKLELPPTFQVSPRDYARLQAIVQAQYRISQGKALMGG
jgi:hypothetical protein